MTSPQSRWFRTDEPTDVFPVAAIVHAAGDPADELLARFALDLRDCGWRVRGIVQRAHGPGKGRVALVDLDNGRRFPLFQNLGGGSVSCSLDPGSVAAASVALRDALDSGADLAVANRFGALEASGGGLAAEMLALMSERLPLLTVVGTAYLSDWRSFTGGIGAELAPTRLALEEWFAQVKYGVDASCARG